MIQDSSEKGYHAERSKKLSTTRYLICKCSKCKKLVYSFHVYNHSEICATGDESIFFKLSKQNKLQLKNIIKERIFKLDLLISMLSHKTSEDPSSLEENHEKTLKYSEMLNFYLEISKKSSYLPSEIFNILTRIFNSIINFNFMKLEAIEYCLKVKYSNFHSKNFQDNQKLKSYYLNYKRSSGPVLKVHLHKQFMLFNNNKFIVGINIENDKILFILNIKTNGILHYYGDFEFLIFRENSVLTIWNIRYFFIEKYFSIDGLECPVYLSLNQSHAIFTTKLIERTYFLYSIDLIRFNLEKYSFAMPNYFLKMAVGRNTENIYFFNCCIFRNVLKYEQLDCIYSGDNDIDFLCLSREEKIIIFNSLKNINVFDIANRSVLYVFSVASRLDLIFCRFGSSYLIIDTYRAVDLNELELKNTSDRVIEDFLFKPTLNMKYKTSSSGIFGRFNKEYIHKIQSKFDLSMKKLGIFEYLKQYSIVSYFNSYDIQTLNDYFINVQNGDVEIVSLKDLTNRKYKFSLTLNFIGRIANSNTFYLNTQNLICLWKANENSPCFAVYDNRNPINMLKFRCALIGKFLIISSSRMFFIVLKMENIKTNYNISENFSSIKWITDDWIIYQKNDKIIRLDNDGKITLIYLKEEKNEEIYHLNDELMGIFNKIEFKIIEVRTAKIIFYSNFKSMNHLISKFIKEKKILLLCQADFVGIYDITNGEILLEMNFNRPFYTYFLLNFVIITKNFIYIKMESKSEIKFFEMDSHETGIIDFSDKEYLTLDFYDKFIITRTNQGIFLYTNLNKDDKFEIPLNSRKGYYICINKFIIIYNDQNLFFTSVIDKAVHEIERKIGNNTKKQFWKTIFHNFILITSEDLLILYSGHNLFSNIEVEVFDLSACSSLYKFSNEFPGPNPNILKIKNSIYIVEHDKKLNLFLRQNNSIVKCSHNILHPPYKTNEIFIDGKMSEFVSINTYLSNSKKMKLIELDDKLIVENINKVFIYDVKTKTVITEIQLHGLLGMKLSADQNSLVLFNCQQIVKYDISKHELFRFELIFHIENLIFLSDDGTKCFITEKYLNIILELELK